ncbi:MAG: dTMP kinase [bacterium]
MSGLFLVFEGIDGSGKGVQCGRLYQFLISHGYETIKTREPTDSQWGRKIAEIAAGGRENISPQEELEFFLKDREHHIHNVIQPSLNEGKIVVCDRYYFSTIAYQGALGIDTDYIRRLNEEQYRFPQPTRVFYLDVPPHIALARIAADRPNGANIGYEQLDYLQKVKAIFDSLDYPFFVRIDGTQTPDETAEIIIAEVESLLHKN